MRSVFCVVLALSVAACSSRRPEPAPPVARYGPASTAAMPPPSPVVSYAPSPTTSQPAPPPSTMSPGNMTPAPTYSGPFRWNTSIADAQAQARREGKLILVGSTKPGCHLCEDFRTRIVPEMSAQVSPIAVGYMVRLDAQGRVSDPGAYQAWTTLRANLARAGLMPLVGVFTPDLRYLTGFGGPADEQKLMNALTTARRLYPTSAAVSRDFEAAPRTAHLNEYGEYEWSPPAGRWPAPEDALGPDTMPQSAPVLAARPSVAPVAPVAPVATLAAPASPPAAPRVASTPPPPAPPTWTPPAAPASRAPSRPTSGAGQVPWSEPEAVAATPPPPPFSEEPDASLANWGESALHKALEQIQSGDLGEARSTLAEIRARLPGSTIARQAAKGSVAIYNVERIQRAEGTQRDRLTKDAYRNLDGSMWGVLFES